VSQPARTARGGQPAGAGQRLGGQPGGARDRLEGSPRGSDLGGVCHLASLQVTEFSRLIGGIPRKPTWAERERLTTLRDAGVEDVFVTPEDAPDEFWRSVAYATDALLQGFSQPSSGIWGLWAQEFLWSTGWPLLLEPPGVAYRNLVADGMVRRGDVWAMPGVGARLAAVEHLLDVVGRDNGQPFEDAINEKARWLHVGVLIEGGRFIPVQGEHMHQETVQPTLLLLSDPDLSGVDDLYRKAFERVLSNDPSGAVTVASSAVETMLRIGLGTTSGTLDSLTQQARSTGWIGHAEAQIIPKLMALRDESDAHKPGTDDFERAMLAIHLTGSILLYLGRSRPSQVEGASN
jgi:hypothetical protein